jgi:hypothetical protein
MYVHLVFATHLLPKLIIDQDRDVFHSFVNTRNLRLLEVLPYIKPIDQSDWDNEDTSERHDLLEPISDRQKASLVAHCELAQICKCPAIYIIYQVCRVN